MAMALHAEKLQRHHFMTQFNSKHPSHMSTNCYVELKE